MIGEMAHFETARCLLIIQCGVTKSMVVLLSFRARTLSLRCLTEGAGAMSFELDGVSYLIRWAICTFDRQKKQLPLEVRHYYLVGDGLSESQRRHIVSLLEKGDDPQIRPRSMSDVVITVSHSVRRDCSAIHQYRALFQPSDGSELDKFKTQSNKMLRVLGVPNEDRYVEDEFGNPITMTDVIRIASGRSDVVLLGDVESVLLIGPADPRCREGWSKGTANQFQHFFELVEQILRSNWLRTPVSMTFFRNEPNPVKTVFPISEQTRSIALLFRQLCSKNSNDNLFNSTCDLYLKFCSAESKRQWVGYEKVQFSKTLTSPPTFPPSAVSLPVNEVLETIFYGAKIFHSNSKHNAESELNNLIQVYGYDKLRFAFHGSLRSLLSHVHNVYFPMRQDYEHWLAQGLERPDPPNLKEF
jgi:hypothetical protein